MYFVLILLVLMLSRNESLLLQFLKYAKFLSCLNGFKLYNPII